MRKGLTIILVIIILAYAVNASAQQEQAEAERVQKEKDAKQAAIDECDKELHNSEIRMKVDSFIGLGHYRTQVLPVFAEDWKPIAEISKEDWPVAEARFKEYGTTFGNMYYHIRNVSSSVVHTGVYKSEFDSIRDRLEQRASGNVYY